MPRIAVIGDTQVTHWADLSYIKHIGLYLADMRPDVVVCIGDWYDLESLSYYDKGKLSSHGRSVQNDIEAGNMALDILEAAMGTYNQNRTYKLWRPRKVFCLGNHEQRIERYTNDNPELEGTIDYSLFAFEDYGWEVYDFNEVVVIEEVCFTHYFTSGTMGRPVSSARALLNKQHVSCVMGHAQGHDIAYAKTGDGRQITGLISGACYPHHFDYLGKQGNVHWRGLYILNDVRRGEFEELPVTLSYLEKKYGGA